MRYETKLLENELSYLNNMLDEELMAFLKRNGYRPKPTEKYMKSLLKRMKRNGYELLHKQEINTVTQMLQKNFQVDTTIYLVKDNKQIDSVNYKFNYNMH